MSRKRRFEPKNFRKFNIFSRLGLNSGLFSYNTLGGGFKYVLFSPLFGEDFHFDEHIFQMG